MSAIKINSKLSEIDSNLDKLDSVVKEGKRKIADAIRFNDIVEVLPNNSSTNDFETFSKYAELIMSIKTRTSPMKLVYTIDPKRISSNAWPTKLKRTIILPIAAWIIDIDKIESDIIASDDGDYSEYETAAAKSAIVKAAPKAAPKKEQVDCFGNVCSLERPTDEDMHNILNDEQKEIYSKAYNSVKHLVRHAPSNSNADYSNADYNYIVDWGDGTVNQYDPSKSASANYDAYVHTYKELGTYMVKIYGNFRFLNGSITGLTRTRTVNGQIVYDKDGIDQVQGQKTGMMFYLDEVRSWGTTSIRSMSNAFNRSYYLKKLPSDLSLKPFKNIDSGAYAFFDCIRLTNIPYDYNLQIGLFSGCKNATSFGWVFAYDSNLTSRIPEKLFDGCSSCVSLEQAFYSTRVRPTLINGKNTLSPNLFKGMTKLTNVNGMFYGANLSGTDITGTKLFKDCVNLELFTELFQSTGVVGTLEKDFFPVPTDETGKELEGVNNKVFDFEWMFRGCGLTAIAPDAFDHIKNKPKAGEKMLFMKKMFEQNRFTSIPEGLFDNFERPIYSAEEIFQECTALKTIPKNIFSSIKQVSCARAMFSNCINLECEMPDEIQDWQSYEIMKKWYATFACCTKMKNFDKIPFELGGGGPRRFPQGSVGKFVLKNKTLCEPMDYVYDDSNPPVGIVYADVYLTEDNNPMLPEASTNITWDASKGIHKLYATTFGESNKSHIKNIEYQKEWPIASSYGIWLYSNKNSSRNGYNEFVYDSSGNQSFASFAQYQGEAYTSRMQQFIFEDGWLFDAGDSSPKDQFKFKTYKDGCSSYKIIDSSSNLTLDSSVLYYIKDSDRQYKAYKVDNNSLVEDSKYNVNLDSIDSSVYPAVSYVGNYKIDGEHTGICFHADIADLYDILMYENWFEYYLLKEKVWNHGNFREWNCQVYNNDFCKWALRQNSVRDPRFNFWLRKNGWPFAEYKQYTFSSKPVFSVEKWFNS